LLDENLKQLRMVIHHFLLDELRFSHLTSFKNYRI
jgi:hypothetical protein